MCMYVHSYLVRPHGMMWLINFNMSNRQRLHRKIAAIHSTCSIQLWLMKPTKLASYTLTLTNMTTNQKCWPIHSAAEGWFEPINMAKRRIKKQTLYNRNCAFDDINMASPFQVHELPARFGRLCPLEGHSRRVRLQWRPWHEIRWRRRLLNCVARRRHAG